MKQFIFGAVAALLGVALWMGFSGETPSKSEVGEVGLGFSKSDDSFKLDVEVFFKREITGFDQSTESELGHYYVECQGETKFVEKFAGFGHQSTKDVRIFSQKGVPDLWLALFQENGGLLHVYGKFLIKRKKEGKVFIDCVDLPARLIGPWLRDFTHKDGILSVSGKEVMKYKMVGDTPIVYVCSEAFDVYSRIGYSGRGILSFQ